MDVISYRNGFSKDDINILKEDVLKVIQHTEEEIPFDDQMLLIFLLQEKRKLNY